MDEQQERQAMEAMRVTAKMIAAYFTALVGNNVPTPSATAITCAYVSAQASRPIDQPKPERDH